MEILHTTSFGLCDFCLSGADATIIVSTEPSVTRAKFRFFFFFFGDEQGTFSMHFVCDVFSSYHWIIQGLILVLPPNFLALLEGLKHRLHRHPGYKRSREIRLELVYDRLVGRCLSRQDDTVHCRKFAKTSANELDPVLKRYRSIWFLFSPPCCETLCILRKIRMFQSLVSGKFKRKI